MAVEFNPKCPDGSHEDGGCVTADPEDMEPGGTVAMPAEAWSKINQLNQKSKHPISGSAVEGASE